AEMDLDVVPIGEVAAQRPVALAVVGLEVVQRLVGEDDAEAERVLRPVALEHGDLRSRPGLLHQDGEVQAGRAAADDVDLHARLHGRASAARAVESTCYFKLKTIAGQA